MLNPLSRVIPPQSRDLGTVHHPVGLSSEPLFLMEIEESRRSTLPIPQTLDPEPAPASQPTVGVSPLNGSSPPKPQNNSPLGSLPDSPSDSSLGSDSASLNHVECRSSDILAGVSDRGIRPAYNQDAFALRACKNGIRIMVVCDGVSCSQIPEQAAQLAAATTCKAIAFALRSNYAVDTALKAAIAQAQKRVSQIPKIPGAHYSPAATTLVAAVIHEREITVAWLGDSRAYWVAPHTSQLLTEDHSWVGRMVASGQMSEAEARRSAKANGVTRWLGAGAGRHAKPAIATFSVTEPGHLLLCTDGLWHYAPKPSHMHTLLSRGPQDDILRQARWLVAYACRQGGRDNVTAALTTLV